LTYIRCQQQIAVDCCNCCLSTVESATRRLHRWHHVVDVQKRLELTQNDPLQ